MGTEVRRWNALAHVAEKWGATVWRNAEHVETFQMRDCSMWSACTAFSFMQSFQHHCSLNFLGLQETRSAAGASLVHHVYRLCSGSNKGHHGVELWCNLKQPYGYIQGRPQYLHKSDFAVVYNDDTRLITKIDASLHQFWVMVFHAPQSGQPQRLREQWWEATHQLLVDHQVQTDQLYVCADANAAPGPGDGRHVFEETFSTSTSTPLLQTFLSTFDLCLPSTSEIHCGPRHTWVRPDGSTSHLIDYVMVPAAQFQACSHSQLLENFDLANLNTDHTATGVELSWWTTVQKCDASHDDGGLRYDRNKIKDGNLNQMLSNYRVASWSTDVETQTHDLTKHIHATLQTGCRRDPSQPKKEYVSSFAWELRRQKLFHRKQLKTVKALLARETIARIFYAWKGEKGDLCQSSFDYGSTLRCGLFKHYAGFRMTSWGLKKHLERDKAFKISEVVASFDATTAASEIQHKMKGFIGSTNKLRQGLAPLPAVRSQNGAPCASAPAVLNRWIQFFADMEGGTRVTQKELHDAWVQSLEDMSMSTCQITIADIPSLCQLEAACRRVKAGKADGPDRIPSEVCKFYPKEAAKLLYGLLLKLVTHGHEPLIHKGGTVVPIWKGKLAKGTCEAFRSILLSSNLGKVIHRTLRVHQRSMYESFLHAQQLGGRQKVPVTLGAHQTRAFLRWQRAQGHSTAILFVDLQEAFYRVLRQLAMPGDFTDLELAQLASRLGLESDVLHDLWAFLQEPHALERASLPVSAQRAIQALHSNTHFQLPNQKDFVSTSMVTRPGDAYADVVFGFLLARVLKVFEEALARADVLSEIPHSRWAGFLQFGGVPGTNFSALSWPGLDGWHGPLPMGSKQRGAAPQDRSGIKSAPWPLSRTCHWRPTCALGKRSSWSVRKDMGQGSGAKRCMGHFPTSISRQLANMDPITSILWPSMCIWEESCIILEKFDWNWAEESLWRIRLSASIASWFTKTVRYLWASAWRSSEAWYWVASFTGLTLGSYMISSPSTVHMSPSWSSTDGCWDAPMRTPYQMMRYSSVWACHRPRFFYVWLDFDTLDLFAALALQPAGACSMRIANGNSWWKTILHGYGATCPTPANWVTRLYTWAGGLKFWFGTAVIGEVCFDEPKNMPSSNMPWSFNAPNFTWRFVTFLWEMDFGPRLLYVLQKMIAIVALDACIVRFAWRPRAERELICVEHTTKSTRSVTTSQGRNAWRVSGSITRWVSFKLIFFAAKSAEPTSYNIAYEATHFLALVPKKMWRGIKAWTASYRPYRRVARWSLNVVDQTSRGSIGIYTMNWRWLFLMPNSRLKRWTWWVACNS